MVEAHIHSVLTTAVVSAFTIAAALIWRDVITEAIELFFPAQELQYKFFVAIIATVIAFIGIYIFLKTEHGAEVVIHKFQHYPGLKPYDHSIIARLEDALRDLKKIKEDWFY